MNEQKSSLERHPLVAFFALAYAITWILQGALAVMGISIATPLGALVNIVAIFGPALAALIVARVQGNTSMQAWLRGFTQWKAGVRWYVIAVGLPLALMPAAFGINAALGGTSPTFARAGLGSILLVEFLRILVLGGPLGEEPGWRGFALPRLQARRSPIVSSLILGVLWGLWHLAIYFVPGTGQNDILKSGAFALSFGGFLVWVLALTMLLTWFYNNTRGSLIIAIRMDSTFVNTGAI